MPPEKVAEQAATQAAQLQNLIIAQYGLGALLLGLFFWFGVWPLIRDYFRPEAAAKRREQEQKRRDAQQRAEQENNDRLFAAFTANTSALVGLQGTLGHIGAEMQKLASGMGDLNEDMAEIYGLVQRPRPSRSRRATDKVEP